MSIPQLHICPGTLAEGFATYSPKCLRMVFNGKKVSHILPYAAPGTNNSAQSLFIENRKRLSISGVQEKMGVVLDGKTLRLSAANEKATYILKPIPRDLLNVEYVPANEHLTMQIAAQVYKIPTAPNAMVFFNDGAPAYITKRFDYTADGRKLGKEDFATLAGKTGDNDGPNFKYNASYERVGKLIQQFVPAWRVEVEKYFRLVVFNYLFLNGDAHLKNFSLLESPTGEYLLAPAYDLLNTRLHTKDNDLALEDGLFEDAFQSAYYQTTDSPCYEDFTELALRIGINPNSAKRLLAPFMQAQPKVTQLVNNSFLSPDLKQAYLTQHHTRLSRLQKQ